jgi:UDP-N-acetylglucosamine--N-acetylmuramyl-(pentapeptide) pyrophosphoryl-undecaprenol N-acetylglucosamine transferase
MAHKQLIDKQLIWLVGGGTGGHIMPLIAVAKELAKRPKIKLVYIGNRRGPEADIAKQAGLTFWHVPSGKLRRYVSFSAIFSNIRDGFFIVFGIWVAFRLIRQHRPHLIFSKGGPSALPVAIAAYLSRTPLITHESDAMMGISNRIIASFATTVLTAFPASVYPSAYAGKIQSVGLPIRSDFCLREPLPHARRPMILVTGGSQGSRAINLLIAEILPDLLKTASVMHICGKQSFQELQEIKKILPEGLAEHYAVLDFTPDIASYMREATLVVTRASSTMFEAASLGKPMIVIPLPGSANDHQMKNAEIFQKHKAAIVLRQDNLTPNLLYETIHAVLQDKKVMSELVEGTRHFSCCDTARRVADIILQQTMQGR